MHEFSLAVNIVEIVEETLQKAGAEKVLSVDIEVGELSGVIIEALEFAMESAVKGTKVEGAGIKILPVDAKCQCEACGRVFPSVDLYSSCPECESFQTLVIEGKEMKVKSIKVE